MRQPTEPTPGEREPAEGRADLDLPGADQADPIPEPGPGQPPEPGTRPRPDPSPPDGSDADPPRRLGERIADDQHGGIASGDADLLPNVDVPKETM